MRFLWGLPAWLLLMAALAAPQAAYFASGSVLLALLAVLVPLGLLGWLLLHVAPTLTSAGACLGVAVALASLVAGFGSAHFQATALLAAGESLDGVSLAEALGSGEQGVWVRLTDARVRSEATHSLSFVSGSGGRPGQPSTQTYSTNVLAPVTLASEVQQEEPMIRRKPTGPVALWACAGDIWTIRAWDSERQAVRGTLTRVEDHVLTSLQKELSPEAPAPIPGAGAIPAAPMNGPPGIPQMPGWPGATTAAQSVEAPAPAPLSVAPDAWCITLDRTLDAATARANAVGSALILVIMVPLFVLGVLMFIVHVPTDPRARST